MSWKISRNLLITIAALFIGSGVFAGGFVSGARYYDMLPAGIPLLSPVTGVEEIEIDPAAVGFRLVALYASRGCAEIVGPGFEHRTFLAAQPKLCARPLGQAGAAGSGGTDD